MMALKDFKIRSQTIVSAIPTIWLTLFFMLPFLFVLKISLSEATLAQPPYLDLVRDVEDGLVTIKINFANYLLLLEDSLYFSALLGSLKVAFISTILCIFES